VDIEGGNNQAAIDRLMKIKENPHSWNNMGVAYARMGDLKTAKSYLEKAAAQGDADAKTNLLELEKYEKDK
jgi:Flp pilus assembly protein TadD